MSTSQYLDLESLPGKTMCPLSTFAAICSNAVICFRILDSDGYHQCSTCCLRRSSLVPHGLPSKSPVIFTVIGQLSSFDCFLTVQGLQGPRLRASHIPICTSNTGTSEITSFWIEARPNIVSEMYWRGMGESIDNIATHFSERMDTTQIFATSETGRPRLQLVWQGLPGQVRRPLKARSTFVVF